MKRGDLVATAGLGAYGKPRPGLVIQSDLFLNHASVTILLLTNNLKQAPLFRITIQPTSENGLKKPSQVMIDKAVTVPAEKLGMVLGRLNDAAMLEVNRALALWLVFA